MKRLIIGCCLLVLMASCGGGQKKVDPFAALTEQIDSMKVLPDSIQDTTVVEEQIPTFSIISLRMQSSSGRAWYFLSHCTKANR